MYELFTQGKPHKICPTLDSWVTQGCFHSLSHKGPESLSFFFSLRCGGILLLNSTNSKTLITSYSSWQEVFSKIVLRTEKETQMYRTDFWTLWEKARVGRSERTASKHVHYQVWNRSPVQVGCMRQVLGSGALGRPRGMGWGRKWEGASGWGTHVNPWLIHVNVWQKPLQYCKVISLQLIKINEKNF